jgi:hypothetical protein
MMRDVRRTFARPESRMPRVIVGHVESDPSPLRGCAQRTPQRSVGWRPRLHAGATSWRKRSGLQPGERRSDGAVIHDARRSWAIGVLATYARPESRMPRVIVCRVESDPSPLRGFAQRTPAVRGRAPTAACRRHFVAETVRIATRRAEKGHHFLTRRPRQEGGPCQGRRVDRLVTPRLVHYAPSARSTAARVLASPARATSRASCCQ